MPSRRNHNPRRRPLVHLADRLFGKVLCITQAKCNTILAVLGGRLGLDPQAIPLYSSPYDVDDNDQDDDQDPYELRAGIAVLPLRGTLVKRASGMDAPSGLSSYEQFGNQFMDAVSNPVVRAIVVDTDSPGGESDGMLPLSDMIYENRGAKPIVAVADGSMCSAAFCVASAAQRILVTRTAMVGSVGAFALHVDQSAQDRQKGLKYEYVFSGARKVDGNPHQALSTRARSELQDEVDRIAGLFSDCVARNRGASAQAFMDTEAGVFFGENALGLFGDSMGEVDDACDMLSAALPSTTYSLPPAALPAAHLPRLLPSASSEWLVSNLKPHASIHAALDLLRSERQAVIAMHGPSVEARVVMIRGARASVSQTMHSDRRIHMLVAPYSGEPHIFGRRFVGKIRAGLFRART
jgi:ClpP class serine protease